MSDVENKIIELYEDPIGFLVQMRVYNKFENNKFDEIVTALSQYAEENKGNAFVHKKVCGFLFDIILVLTDTLTDTLSDRSQQRKEALDRVLLVMSDICFN